MDKIFDLETRTGEWVSGFYGLQRHASGIIEKIPVLVFEGEEEGPTLSVSANLHGDEHTGTLVVHRLLRDRDIKKNLKGTLILMPSLNPFGTSMSKRSYSYTDEDPNRMFPEEDSHSKGSISFVEYSMEKIYSELVKHTDIHIDLHCSKIHSEPFIYIDPLMKDTDERRTVMNRSKNAAEAFGLFVLFDNFDSYIGSDYHRTLTGSLVQNAKLPAFTVELGPKKVVDREMVQLGHIGIKNVLSHLGMLSDHELVNHNLELRPVEDEYEINLHPRMKSSGVIEFLVKPGEYVERGQKIATIRDIFGKDIGDGFVRTEKEGYVICQYEGGFFNRGEPLLKIATELENVY